MNRTLRFIFMPLALTALACGDLQPIDNGEPDGGSTPVDGGDAPSAFRHELSGDGTVTTTVNATSAELWHALDLDAREDADARVDATWDVSFQRFHIRTRGGVNGSGGVRVAMIDTPFDEVARAPSGGWREDEADGPDPRSDAGGAFMKDGGWYSYDLATHTLGARPVTFVVETDEDRYFKLQFLGYYDEAGSPGMVRFRWKEVAAPVDPEQPSDLLEVDASSSTAWVYVKVGEGVIEVPDPATSTAWDLAFRRTRMVTNGGESGPGLGGAREEDADSLAGDITGTVGFVTDALLPIPGPPGSGSAPGNAVLDTWFDYDMTTHAVSPRDTTFVVRTAAGGYARLRIASHAAGRYTLRLTPLERQVETVRLTVDASGSTDFVPLSLSEGRVLDLEEDLGRPLSGSERWELALRRTAVRTNGGESGPGACGALHSGETTLDAVTSAPADGYVADTLIAPPMGGEPASGNTVLGDWYDYDFTTHAVTPKPAVYLVRVTGGGYAKVRIAAWTGGVWTLEYAYTGPGHADF